jgi:hypothetical protein
MPFDRLVVVTEVAGTDAQRQRLVLAFEPMFSVMSVLLMLDCVVVAMLVRRIAGSVPTVRYNRREWISL